MRTFREGSSAHEQMLPCLYGQKEGFSGKAELERYVWGTIRRGDMSALGGTGVVRQVTNARQ
jgi:hypothetical protein